MASALPRNICFLHSSENPPYNQLFCISRTVSSPPPPAFRRNCHISLHLRSGAGKSRLPRLSVRAKDNPDPNSPPDSTISSSLGGLRKVFRVDDLGIEILSIALPAALALAADPITSLVDTAFVGHLGSVELAAVGISVSVFNLVSKLFNVPLLNITTSFVAEEQASSMHEKNSIQINHGTVSDDSEQKKLLASVSTSLALAAAVGFVEAVALSFGSGHLMNFMGISVDSPMHVPAEQFLKIRALGAPPIAIALAAQGTFRGFKDTKTPLYAIGAGNLLNAVLDLLLIFPFGFGISGAAIATVISEYLIALILLFNMSEKVSFTAPNIDGSRVLLYLQSGGLLAARSLAVLGIMTLSTSMAAQQGPIAMAGHEICIQVWLAISLLTDALALAGQALLADDYSQGNYEESHQVTCRILQIGLLTGSGLSIILFLGFHVFSSLFTSDPEVLKVAWSGLLFVAGSQPMNAIAFVLDGLYYGVSDFGYAAFSMIIAALISSVFMVVATPAFGLAGVWTSLFLFMTLRVLAGAWRLGTKAGPWRLIWLETK